MEPQSTKAPWQSRTLWTAIIFAIIPLFPPAAVWVAANPAAASALVAGVFAALRMGTKGKITVK